MAHISLALTAAAMFGILLYTTSRWLDRRVLGLLLMMFSALTIFLLLTRAGGQASSADVAHHRSSENGKTYER
jgi:uncharacterized membrane protein